MTEERNNSNGKFTKKINGILIDPLIFTYKSYCSCVGDCCYHGVYTDYKEYQYILSIQDKIKEIMDETQSRDVESWFEAPQKDDDFESGIAVGTEVINGKCTFLDKNGLCSLQKLALKEGEFKWKHKPLYCVLFPLTVFEGVLSIDTEDNGEIPYCKNGSKTGLTFYEAYTEELKHLFGDDGFLELENYREEYLKEINVGVNENVDK
ncbi:MAG: DUF3109 family protein [Ignavibacteriales bacterium]